MTPTPDLGVDLDRLLELAEKATPAFITMGGPAIAIRADVVSELIRRLRAAEAGGLDAAWREAEAALPKSKGRWGYSIAGLDYTTRGWRAKAHGNLSGEYIEGYGATAVAALQSLTAAALRESHDA